MTNQLTHRRFADVFRLRSLLCGVFAAWIWCYPASGAAKVQKTVLLFYDAVSDMRANVVVDQTIRSVLNREFDVDLDIRSEFAGLSASNKMDHPILESWLRRKYNGIAFDVVVAVGTGALEFVKEYDKELFPGAQIVYWGRRTALDNWGKSRPVTGVVNVSIPTHANATIDFIQTLQPDLQHLVVVNGVAEIDRDWETALRNALQPFVSRIDVSYLAGLPIEEVLKRVANLPKRTAILVVAINQDGAGRRLYRTEILTKIVDMSSAPVYSTSTVYLPTGIVGGAMASQEAMSIEAADMIAQLLRGKKVVDLPIRESPLVPMVNWRGLTQWRIPEDRLPAKTVILDKTPSLWDQYKWHVFSAISLCAVEGLLILALLVHRVHRQRAEKAMRESKQLLQSTIDSLSARVALLDEEATIIAVNEPWRAFAQANSYDGVRNGIGWNYVKVCDNSNTDEARLVATGLRNLLAGDMSDFRCVYPSSHEGETSWFQVRVKPFHAHGVLRIVVAHENVTEIKQAHDAQQQLTNLLMRTQDDARRRIARDLHDVTVQDLAAIRADLTRIELASQSMGAGIRETFDESLALCDQVIKDLRTLSYLLHPPLLDEAGLVPALQWFVRGFIQRSGVQVELLVMEDIGRLGSDIETALFRVVQECLTNIHRHSGSKSAVIWVTKEDGTVRIQIADEGRGFAWPSDPDHDTTLSMGVGIMGMRQRLKQLGGELEIESNAHGTTVNAKIKISEGQDAAYSLSR
jgi:two-component system NarL family sensor kinase